MSSPLSPPYHVLIVEDEYLIADDLARTIAAQGFEVATLGNVGATRKALDTIPVDFAVLDVNLAGEMVFDLARELQSRAIPFLFLTGYDHDRLPDEFGAVRLLQKPCEDNVIVAEIRDQRSRGTAAG